jgi:hypothetical protein
MVRMGRCEPGFLPQVTCDYHGRTLTNPYRPALNFTNVYHS